MRKYIENEKLALILIGTFAWLLLISGISGAAEINDLRQELNKQNISAGVGSSGPLTGSVVGCEGSALNIRDGAWGNIIGTLANGSGVAITGEDGDWYKISHNGGESYVYKSYVAVTNRQQSQAAAAGARSGSVTGCEGSALNVRDGVWGNIIGALGDGESVSIIGEDGDWYKISYNGSTAYVYKSYVSAAGAQPGQPVAQQPPAADATQNSSGTVTGCEGSALNVRSGAWGDIIGTLADGAGVTITGEDGDWYKIDYNGSPAYVYKSYISKGGSAPQPPAAQNNPPASDPGASFDSNGALNVPLVGQPDGHTCGPTSLSMALRYYGIEKSIHPELAGLCGTTTNGTNSTDNIVSAAKQLGLSGSYAKSGTIDWLAEVTASGRPVVVNVAGGVWSGGHYVVVTGVKNGTVYINDPAWGYSNEKGHSGNRITLDVNTFSSIWGARWNRAAVIQK